LELAGSVTPAVVPPIHTVFYTGLVAVGRSDAGGEKRASRSGCEHEIDGRFWREAQSRSSIGSQLSTRTLMRFHQTGLGLGVEADLLFTLASHPPEVVSHKFDAIRFVVDIAPGRLGQTLHQLRTIEEHTHLGVQFA
jgi:hypothetical protein